MLVSDEVLIFNQGWNTFNTHFPAEVGRLEYSVLPNTKTVVATLTLTGLVV